MAKKVNQDTVDKLQEAMDRMNKTYGVGTVLTLDSNSTGVYDVISSGSIGFDWITLGVGGWIKGKMYELKGWEGSSKTTVCGHAVAECQKQGGKVLYIDGEHAVDKPYFQALGVDTSKLLFSQPECGEEAFQIVEEMLKTGEIDLIIIDSDSSLIPKSVIVDGAIGDSSIGKKARLNSSAYPKLKNLLVQYKTCIIVTSQYREKIGVMYGPNMTTQGGHALKYYADCVIEITKSMAKDGDITYGNVTKVKATKNKMCPPYRVSQFEVVWGKGIDAIGELVDLAVEYEIVKKSGSWYSYGDIKLGQGTAGVTALLNDNPELYDEVRQKLIDKLRHTEDLPIDETSEEELVLNSMP
jgi:recombination protein RecA